ncbi:MAG: hypothetical protein Q9213_001214 [Squamulea squamosa]
MPSIIAKILSRLCGVKPSSKEEPEAPPARLVMSKKEPAAPHHPLEMLKEEPAAPFVLEKRRSSSSLYSRATNDFKPRYQWQALWSEEECIEYDKNSAFAPLRSLRQPTTSPYLGKAVLPSDSSLLSPVLGARVCGLIELLSDWLRRMSSADARREATFAPLAVPLRSPTTSSSWGNAVPHSSYLTLPLCVRSPTTSHLLSSINQSGLTDGFPSFVRF